MIAEGLNPYNMSMQEVHLALYGIRKKRIEEKRNVRSMMYAIHVHMTDKKDRLEVWELMEIEGDPTKKEREKAAKLEAKRLEKGYLKEIERYRELGYIK